MNLYYVYFLIISFIYTGSPRTLMSLQQCEANKSHSQSATRTCPKRKEWQRRAVDDRGRRVYAHLIRLLSCLGTTNVLKRPCIEEKWKSRLYKSESGGEERRDIIITKYKKKKKYWRSREVKSQDEILKIEKKNRVSTYIGISSKKINIYNMKELKSTAAKWLDKRIAWVQEKKKKRKTLNYWQSNFSSNIMSAYIILVFLLFFNKKITL